MKRTFTYTITPDYDGENLKTLLKRHFKMSSNLVKTLKKYDEGIRVNGAHERVSYILKTGDEVSVTLVEGASENIAPIKLPLDIVYEDEDVMVINKPPAMPTHPSPDNYDNTLANALMYYFLEKGEERVFRAVNRLDKDTSGLMAAAKNSYVHARLAEDLKEKKLRRKYTAIVCGEIDEDGIIDAPIKRREGSAIERAVAEDGQRAVTRYKILEKLDGYTVLELELETGRTHQIRVHMAYIGHPLLGDWLYGEENHALFDRPALHSCFLEMTHPLTGETLKFTAPLPEDMRKFIVSRQKLRQTY